MENNLIKYPYGLDDPYSIIELISYTEMVGNKYGGDQIPVLAARVSHANAGKTGEDITADLKLLNYLAANKHTSPFEHQTATFRVVAPLFVFREWHRHRTQSYNEVSMRYSSDPVGRFYVPKKFRMQGTRNKQAGMGDLEDSLSFQAEDILRASYNNSLSAYNNLLDIGVCREQARAVIPVGNYSEMYASANLLNWFKFWLLRADNNAQWEIRQYAYAIDEILSEIYPKSWGALKNNV